MKGFYDKNEKTPDQKIRFDTECAKLLGNKLKSKRLILTYNIPIYEKQFRLLRKQHEEKTITKVLKWYLIHMEDEYIPKIDSAKSFRYKYDKILSKYEELRSIKEISDKAKEMAILLLRKKWPSGLNRLLPNLVERSIQNYTEFRKRFKQIISDCESSPDRNSKRLLLFMNYILEMHLYRPSMFVGNWMESFRESVIKMGTWNGSPKPLIFKYDGERFSRWGYLWSDNWCGDSTLWDLLLERMKQDGDGSV